MSEPEVAWALAQAQAELATVQTLLQDSMRQLGGPTRLPVSTSKTETAKGILSREGAGVKASVQVKMSRGGPFSFRDLALSLAQVSVALDAMSQAERRLGTAAGSRSLARALHGIADVGQFVEHARNALKVAPSYVRFPEQVNAAPALPPGICVDVYVQDYELVMKVHVYQDRGRGHVALETVAVMSPDPNVMAVGAKLEAGLHRLDHVYTKLANVAVVAGVAL